MKAQLYFDATTLKIPFPISNISTILSMFMSLLLLHEMNSYLGVGQNWVLAMISIFGPIFGIWGASNLVKSAAMAYLCFCIYGCIVDVRHLSTSLVTLSRPLLTFECIIYICVLILDLSCGCLPKFLDRFELLRADLCELSVVLLYINIHYCYPYFFFFFFFFFLHMQYVYNQITKIVGSFTRALRLIPESRLQEIRRPDFIQRASYGGRQVRAYYY
jgi:hypothetical protein